MDNSLPPQKWGKNTAAGYLVLFIVLSQLLYSILHFPYPAPIERYVLVSIINSALYVGLCYILHRGSAAFSDSVFWLVLIVGIALRGSVLSLYPTASDDIYRYIWDGKVQAAGISPYAYAPSDGALAGLHSDMLPRLVNFPGMRTIYPPAAEWIFWLSYRIFGESIIGFKIPLLLAEIATLFLFRSILRDLRLPAVWTGLYAFCPLPIMQFMIDGHLDALGLPFVLLFILLWLRHKELPALFALGIASAVKLLPLILIPFAFKESRGWRRIAAVAVPIGVLGAAYLPYLAGQSAPFEALGTFSSRWEFNGSVFHILYPFVQDNTPVHTICTGLYILWVVYVYFRKTGFLDMLRLSVFGFFIFAPTVHPWYLTWLAVFLPLRFRWSTIAFVAVVSLANIVVIEYKVSGIWRESMPLLVVEYGILAAVIAAETLRDRRRREIHPLNA